MNDEQIKWLAELVKVLERRPDGLNILHGVDIELSGHKSYTEIVVYTIQRTKKDRKNDPV